LSAEAFTRWYEEHFDYVWRTLARLGIGAADRADLAQDIFSIVYQQIEGFDFARPVKPWLFGIAYRRALDFKRKRQLVTEELIDQGATPAYLEEHVAQRQGLELMQEFLASLDEEKRPVFILHDLDGEPVPRIAEAQGIPLNTAYSRLRLARHEFEAFVKRVQARERSAQ
jgi:RNA polymerase sigma-70 factor (ECF subfamily)